LPLGKDTEAWSARRASAAVEKDRPALCGHLPQTGEAETEPRRTTPGCRLGTFAKTEFVALPVEPRSPCPTITGPLAREVRSAEMPPHPAVEADEIVPDIPGTKVRIEAVEVALEAAVGAHPDLD